MDVEMEVTDDEADEEEEEEEEDTDDTFKLAKVFNYFVSRLHVYGFPEPDLPESVA